VKKYSRIFDQLISSDFLAQKKSWSRRLISSEVARPESKKMQKFRERVPGIITACGLSNFNL